MPSTISASTAWTFWTSPSPSTKAFAASKMPLEQWTQEVNDGKVSTEEYFVLGNLCRHIDLLREAKTA